MLKVNKSFLFQRERTALHLAAEKGNLDAVEKLLEHGADINKKDKVCLIMSYACVTWWFRAGQKFSFLPLLMHSSEKAIFRNISYAVLREITDEYGL